MLEPVSHPWYFRLADRTHGALERAGAPLVSLEPEEMIGRVCRRVGLSDFGGGSWREGLDVLCASLEEEADLNLFGRVGAQGGIEQALEQRLRLTELRRTRPEIFERPLNRPVIVCGLPRSGTTLLHRLLATGPGTRALMPWELRSPIPGPEPDRRRAEMQRLLRTLHRAAPKLDAKHRIDVDEPEECVLLHDPSFRSFSFWMFYPVYRYLTWLRERDMGESYRMYRDFLQVFQAEAPDARLVLKAPPHAGWLPELLDAVPEATVIHTHRDPVPAIGSVNSLFHTIHSAVSRSTDHQWTARVNLDVLAWTMDRALMFRPSFAEGQVVDLMYDDLVADGLGAVGRVAAAADLPVDEEAVRQRLVRRPKHHCGKHTYSLEEHGLTEAEVRTRFARYLAAYPRLKSDPSPRAGRSGPR